MIILADNVSARRGRLFSRPIILFVFVGFVMSSFCSGSARAEAADDRIYEATLKIIVEHEQPNALAISEQLIGRAAMTSPRVPRHDPYGQFKRALPGISGKLEQALIAGAAEEDKGNSINQINVSYPGVSFFGFVRYSTIKQLEKNAGNELLVVGFSKIAYDDSGRNALLYTESCLTGNHETCSGEGFWFEEAAAGWQVRKHAYLWAGSNRPFWDVK